MSVSIDNSCEEGNLPAESAVVVVAAVSELKAVAKKYAEQAANADGWFQPTRSDRVETIFDKETYKSYVIPLLQYSGLVLIDPVKIATPRYRFEPDWLHEYLIYSGEPGSYTDCGQ